MKNKISTFLLLLAATAAGAQDKVIFKGTADTTYNGYKVYLYNNITKENDSATIENGRFEIVRPFTQATRHMFSSQYEAKVHRGYSPFGILVDRPGEVTIEANMDRFYQSKIKGSPAHAVYDAFQQKLDSYEKVSEKKLAAQFGADKIANPQQYKDDPSFEAMTAAMEKASEEDAVKAAKDIAGKNPNSVASPFILDRYGRKMPVSVKEKLFSHMSKSVKESYFGKRLANDIEGSKSATLGNTVKDFTLNDANGKPVRFGSLKGKYVLIDFWASWCGPCREEFKHMRPLYEKYKGTQFEILGISTDENEKAWQTAMTQEKLPWLQIHDVKGDKSVAEKQFAVKVLPTMYLIDPNGKIIAKDLRGEALEKKLEELFRK